MRIFPVFLLFWCSVLAAHAAYPVCYLGAGADGGFDTIDINTVSSNFKAIKNLPVVSPQPGAKLSYTQIMFDHPQVTGADWYLVEVALDNDNKFTHPLFTQKDSSTATMLGNFEFGKKYIWRYTGMHNNTPLGWQGPYNFETLYSSCLNKNQYRVNVVQNDSSESAGGLVMLDMGRCIDRYGNVVWFLYDSTIHFCTPPMMMQDLRMTNNGTVTMLGDLGTCEKDLNGKLLWQVPAPPATNRMAPNALPGFSYHHCFKKLRNGNYMVLALNAMINPALPQKKAMLSYEIIKEFNPAGQLVWKWSSENYFDTAELEKLGLDKPDPFLNNRMAGGHMNAFDVDEKNGFVYAGFRNISRIIKIDKSTGEVVCAWGDNINYHGQPNANGFFSKQHGITLLRDGSIAVFSNNAEPIGTGSNAISSSSVAIFTQPANGQNSRLLFKYDCAFSATTGLSNRGGNVDELNNNNLLVCMGAVNRIFEITRNKKIVWNALIEKHEDHDSAWHPFAVYRAHYTSSLYPCYFTVQTTPTGIKIFNNGSEADSYQVSISPTTGSPQKQFSTDTLPAKKSLSLNLHATGAETITITSQTNPGFKREVSIK